MDETGANIADYDLLLVALSFAVAMMGAYVAMELVSVMRTRLGWARAGWIMLGGIALGSGIWSTHFVGMLAYRLPFAVWYALGTTALSLVPAVLGATTAFAVVTSRLPLLLAAIPMGLAIVAMHFIGMSALTLVPDPGWDQRWIAASVLIAIGASWLALHLLRMQFATTRSDASTSPSFGAAALMAAAICGMHYAGMTAFEVQPGSFCRGDPGTARGEPLGVAALTNTLALLLVLLTVSRAERRLIVAALAAERLRAELSSSLASEVERRAQELTGKLRLSQQRFALAAAGAEGGIWECVVSRREIFLSQPLAQLLMLNPGECYLPLGLMLGLLQPPARRRLLRDLALIQADGGGRPLHLTLPVDVPGLGQRMLAIRGAVALDADGGLARLAGSCVDVTLERQHERQLRAAAKVFEHSVSPILLATADLTVLDVNPAFERLLGIGAGLVVGRALPRLERLQLSEPLADILRTLRRGETWSGDVIVRSAEGKRRTLRAVAAAPRVADDHIEGFILQGEDVTELRFLEAQAAALAQIDALTGLPNRTALALRSAIGENDPEFAAIVLDLDGFRLINELQGHAAGDAVLRHVAEGLREALAGEKAQAFRIGGDQFLVLLPRASLALALARAGTLVQRLSRPLGLTSNDFATTLSAGVAAAPCHGVDVETVVRRAEMALFAAKTRGPGAVAGFDAQQETGARRAVALPSDLAVAFHAGELDVRYQPIVRLSDGALGGVECLLLWRQGQLGEIGASSFIAQRENDALIDDVTDWVIDQACATLARAPRTVSTQRVAVNISGYQFHRPQRLLASIDRALAALPPGWQLELEMVERQMLELDPATLGLLHDLRARGVGLSVDDFGSGFSSLNLLQDAPVSSVKIDRAFTPDLGRGGPGTAIAQAIVDLGARLGIDVVAEGVELPEQLIALRRLGCSYAQGYLLGRALPAVELLERLHRPPAPPAGIAAA